MFNVHIAHTGHVGQFELSFAQIAYIACFACIACFVCIISKNVTIMMPKRNVETPKLLEATGKYSDKRVGHNNDTLLGVSKKNAKTSRG